MTISPAVVLEFLLLLAGQVAGDSPKTDGVKDEKAARMEHMKQAARSYEIVLAAPAAKKLVLVDEPLLRFDDQVTGVIDGTVFMWKLDDRPVATASIWIRRTGHELHEFQSLTADALSALNEGQAKWAPSQPGIERKPVPNAEPPAVSAVRRLIQMRAVAREYSATVADSEKNQQVLRLLPQPVYRYGHADSTVADGALFAFCKGTNPEILLVVEAVRKANGEGLEWNYAFARMTSRGCEVRCQDQVVWTAPRVAGGTRTDPYYNVVQLYRGPGATLEKEQ